MWFQIAALAAVVPAVIAVYTDEAYKVDSQLALLGLPQSENTFFAQPNAGSKASLLYTLSEKCVLGAVNPKDGSLVWRQLLKTHGECTSGILRAGENQDTLVTALDGKLQAWSAAHGRLAWEKRFEPDDGIFDVQITKSAGEDQAQDVIVVLGTSHATVQRLDGRTGVQKWFSSTDDGDEPYMVSASANAIYYISLHPTGKRGNTVKVASLNTETGARLDQFTLGSESEIYSDNDVILAGANSATPVLAWTDITKPTTLKINVLGTKKTATFAIEQSNGAIKAINILAPQALSTASDFLIHYQTAESHWAEVYHIDPATSQVEKQYDLPVAAGQGAFSLSTVGSAVYFTRFTEGEVTLFSSTSVEALQRWPLKVADLHVRGDLYPVHASTELAVRTGASYAVRSAILFSSGDWAMVRNGDFSWSRSESLAGIVTAQWASVRVEDALVEELKVEGQSNLVSAYIHRVKRHLHDMVGLPQLLTKTLGQLTSIGGITEISETFGFQKLIIAATDNGRVIALEAGSGLQVVWNVEAKGKPANVGWDSPTLGSATNRLPEKISSTLEFSGSVEEGESTTYELKDNSLHGIKSGVAVWQFSPRPGQKFIEVTSSYPDEPIASIGKALGDRKVLYKYLNPNAIIVVAVDQEYTATIYLVDASSGKLLNAAEHSSVDTSRPIAAAVSENWFAYSMTIFASGETDSAGHILVVSELYESSLPNDRGVLGPSTNYSSLHGATIPHVISATFIIPEEISVLGVTQTVQGITSRQLLAYTPALGSIVAIPRQAIDPRRLVNADPTALQAQDEGLSRYHAFLDFDPKWYLTHKRDVLGVRHISATPAALESTSLVVAWGLDVFATRVAPSFAFDLLGSEFNKATMSATVVVLAAAAFVVAPLIERKMTNTIWQSV